VAAGAEDPAARGHNRPVRPDDKVRMVPLPGERDTDDADNADNTDGADDTGDGSSKGARGSEGASQGRTGAGGSTQGNRSGGAEDDARAAGGEASGTGPSGSKPFGSGDTSGSHSTKGPSGPSGSNGSDGSAAGSGGAPSSPDSPGSPNTPGSPDAPGDGPAVLTAGKPKRAEADDRWCEKVTVRFTNSGGAPVTKGKVTFEIHIIDALGIDWATRESSRALPVPIEAGADKEKTWKVCVDAWRVPLGMHIETGKLRLSGWD
jgi:hypothetical protein